MYDKMRIFCIAIISVCCMVSMVKGTLQQMTFFQNTGCTGENDIITDTRNDLNDTRMGQAASMRIMGPWRIVGYRTLEGGQVIKMTIKAFNGKPPNGTCGDWDGSGFIIHSAQRLGGTDMAESQVVFYTEEDFSGELYMVDQSMSQVGPEPFESLSYVLFSNTMWMVYPEQNFTGPPTIIGPDANGVEDPSNDFSYSESKKYTVGSIRKLISVDDNKI